MYSTGAVLKEQQDFARQILPLVPGHRVPPSVSHDGSSGPVFFEKLEHSLSLRPQQLAAGVDTRRGVCEGGEHNGVDSVS